MCWKAGEVWKVESDVIFFFRLPGVTQYRAKDDEGQKWNDFMYSHLEHDYVESTGGLEGMKSNRHVQYVDWRPVWRIMHQENMLKEEELLRMIIGEKSHAHAH
jgi:hypothetical protein